MGWFGRFRRRGEEFLGKIVMKIGGRRNEKKGQIKKEMAGLHKRGPETQKADRGRSSKQSALQTLIRNIDPT